MSISILASDLRKSSSSYKELFNDGTLTVYSINNKFEVNCGSTHTVCASLKEVAEKVDSLPLHIYAKTSDSVVSEIKNKLAKHYRFEVIASKNEKETTVHTVEGTKEVIANSLTGMVNANVMEMVPGRRYSCNGSVFGGDYMLLIPVTVDEGFDFDVTGKMYEPQVVGKGTVMTGVNPIGGESFSILIDEVYPNGAFKDSEGKIYSKEDAELYKFQQGQPISEDESQNFSEPSESLFESEDLPSYNPTGEVAELAPNFTDLSNYDNILSASAGILADFMKTAKGVAYIDRSSLNKIRVSAINKEGKATDGEVEWNVRLSSPKYRRSSQITVPLVMKAGSIDLGTEFITSTGAKMPLTVEALSNHLGELVDDDFTFSVKGSVYPSTLHNDSDIDFVVKSSIDKRALDFSSILPILQSEKFLDDQEVQNVLRLSLSAEEDATQLYETISKKLKDENFRKLFQDVADEEKVHVGEFEALLDMVDPTNKELTEKGKEEAESKVTETETKKEETDKVKESSMNKKAKGWDVYLKDKLIDTVFDDSDDAEDVKRSLINHDGYDPAIEVRGSKKIAYKYNVEKLNRKFYITVTKQNNEKELANYLERVSGWFGSFEYIDNPTSDVILISNDNKELLNKLKTSLEKDGYECSDIKDNKQASKKTADYDSFRDYCRTLTDRQVLNVMEKEKEASQWDDDRREDYLAAKAEADARGILASKKTASYNLINDTEIENYGEAIANYWDVYPNNKVLDEKGYYVGEWQLFTNLDGNKYLVITDNKGDVLEKADEEIKNGYEGIDLRAHWASKKTANKADYSGRYITLKELDNGNLSLTLTKEGEEELLDKGENINEDEKLLQELLEDAFGNGWTYIYPEQIDALTNAPIIGYDVEIDDKGVLVNVDKVWWYPDYQIKNPIEVMLRDGSVEFISADKNGTDKTSKKTAAYGEKLPLENPEEYAADLESSIQAIFPEGDVSVRYSENLTYSIMVTFTSKTTYTNNIAENDPAFTRIFIYGRGDKLQAEMTQGGLRVKPSDPKSYFAFEKHPDVKFRKKTGTPDQVKDHILNYFENLKTVIDSLGTEDVKITENKETPVEASKKTAADNRNNKSTIFSTWMFTVGDAIMETISDGNAEENKDEVRATVVDYDWKPLYDKGMTVDEAVKHFLGEKTSSVKVKGSAPAFTVGVVNINENASFTKKQAEDLFNGVGKIINYEESEEDHIVEFGISVDSIANLKQVAIIADANNFILDSVSKGNWGTFAENHGDLENNVAFINEALGEKTAKKTAASPAQIDMLANSFVSNMKMYKEDIDNGTLTVIERAIELVMDDASWKGYPKFSDSNKKEVKDKIIKGMTEIGFDTLQAEEAVSVLDEAFKTYQAAKEPETKVAYTSDGSDITETAQEVMDIDSNTWIKNGWQQGRDVKIDVLKEALKGISAKVTDKDIEVLEDYNFYSAVEAINQLKGKK